MCHLEDVGELALAVRDVPGASPTEGDDALLQVTKRLVDVHTFLLYRLVGHRSPFQSLLRHPPPPKATDKRMVSSVCPPAVGLVV